MNDNRDLPGFLVRLLGLYWMISGVSGMISNGLDAALQNRTSLREGFDLFPSTSLAWFIGETVLVLLGIHLVLKYEDILEFLAPKADSQDRAD